MSELGNINVVTKLVNEKKIPVIIKFKKKNDQQTQDQKQLKKCYIFSKNVIGQPAILFGFVQKLFSILH